MAERRTKGEGSIFFSRSEKTWIAEITLPDGKRRKKRNKSKSVIQDWLFEQRKAISENRLLANDKMTFNEFTEMFLKDVAKHSMKAKTYDAYEGYLRLHIRPDLGHMSLASIQPQHIQRLYTKKLNSGLSKKTVHHIHAYLRRVLNEAVKWELLYRNPCSMVTPLELKRKHLKCGQSNNLKHSSKL